METCVGCPLAEGEKFLTTHECRFSPGDLRGDACLVQLQWVFEDLINRIPEFQKLEAITNMVISPLSVRERMVLGELVDAPLTGAFANLWYEGKALELLALSFSGCDLEPSAGRQGIINRDRVKRVCSILNRDFVSPPSLDELSRQVGCSKFCLSRAFSEVMGMSIPQFIRERRIREAACLLRAGRHNVTEAAIAVGYQSVGHFSTAFREIMGCCPGLYPLSLTHTAFSEKLNLEPLEVGATHRKN